MLQAGGALDLRSNQYYLYAIGLLVYSTKKSSITITKPSFWRRYRVALALLTITLIVTIFFLYKESKETKQSTPTQTSEIILPPPFDQNVNKFPDTRINNDIAIVC